MSRARRATALGAFVVASISAAATLPAQRAPLPSIVERARIDTASGVNFHALVEPETVYVGQQATYQVGVFLGDEVRYRLRRNPEFVPPELRSMLSYDLMAPGATLARRREGTKGYDTHVFQRAIFPLSAGTFVIPPARLTYSLPLSASFFSREESHSLSSEEVRLVALDPPAQGRPAGFAGAVGDIRVESRVDSVGARVGDPLVVTVRVGGSGNVNLFPRPVVSVPWGRTVTGDERVQLDSTSAVVRGTKEFDYLITPVASGAHELPAVRYPYFNPYTERYEIAVAEPRALTVAPGGLAPADPIASRDSAAALPIRRVMRADPARPLFERGAYWFVMLLAPIPALALVMLGRPKPRPIARAEDELRALASLARSNEPGDRPKLRRAYARALAARVGATPALLADRRAFVRALRRAGVSADSARRADEVLAALDTAVYARERDADAGLARRAVEALEAVDREAMPRHSIARTVAWSALLAATLGAGVAARALHAQDDAPTAFRRGAESFDAHRWAESAAHFERAARLRPRSSDAWANVGTVAWVRGDSVDAVVGWQRALRLEPAATDVRERLEMVPGFDGGAAGDVPRIAPDVAALAGGALWLVAWLALAVALRRRDVLLRRFGIGCAFAGACVVGVGIWARVRTVGGTLSVITPHARLLAAPTLGADDAAAVHTGELARTVAEQGAWSRVRLSDGRDGWIETERLRPLGALR